MSRQAFLIRAGLGVCLASALLVCAPAGMAALPVLRAPSVWAPAPNAVPGLPAPSPTLLPVKKVQIGTTVYRAGDVQTLLGSFVRTGSINTVLRVVRLCKSASSWAFVSIQNRQGGIVAWMPNNPIQCLGVTGGGPGAGGGGPSNSPCLQAYRTPADQDPGGVHGQHGTAGRYYVFIAGTGGTICADLTTQVPGGVWGRTTAAVPGLPARSVIPIKCQEWRTDSFGKVRLVDYLAPLTSSLPANKSTFRLYDDYVETGIVNRLANVPSCSGTG
jgi:hypothetical protein